MKRVSVTDLKNRLSEYLRLVKRGETIEILERSVPIARIHGVTGEVAIQDARLERLVHEGVVRRPAVPFVPALLERPPIPCSGDAVQAVIEGRGER